MENDKITMDQAVELFDQQQYREAFAAFAEIYNQSQDENERKAIFEMLVEAFYAPNTEDLHANYNKNCSLLANYPYQWGFQKCSIEDLPVQIFPATETEYCLFDKQRRTFSELRVINSGQLCDYLFRDLSRPIFRENDCNLYHLQYLEDNVRRSEDYGGDNHIYLYYVDLGELAPLLLLGELEPLLNQKKPVFLIGEENKRRYPIDFKKEFQIDYASIGPTPVRIEEIKRIIFGWKIANVSGTSFLADIMDFHPDLLTIPDCVMHSFVDLYNGQLKGKTRPEAVSFLKRLPDEDPRKAGIINLVRNDSVQMSESLRKEFNRASAEEFLAVLESVMAEFPCPSAREWLIGIFLTYSCCHKRTFGRVIPALFLYPHDDMFYLAGIEQDRVNFYFDLVGSFPYHKVIALIRNPVTQAGSVANFMTHGHPQARNLQGEVQLDPFYCVAVGSFLPKDYYFPLQHPLRESIRVVRFEDLKLNPKATFASMAEFLNISVTQSMFHTTWCGLTRDGITTENTVFDGFDPAPVYKSYNQYLSVFDKYRIELLLRDLIEVYGYQAKYYDGQQFSYEEIVKMMELPFLLESIKTALPPARKHSSRESGMRIIKAAAAIKGFPFARDDGTEQFAPLPWLRPKEELLEQPLYR